MAWCSQLKHMNNFIFNLYSCNFTTLYSSLRSVHHQCQFGRPMSIGTFVPCSRFSRGVRLKTHINLVLCIDRA